MLHFTPKTRISLAFLAFSLGPNLALAQPNDAPKLQISAEEPTGVFFDRDTLLPQTPILFTVRVENPANESREVVLSWKITDANGNVRLRRGGKFTLDAEGKLVRRELFDAPARGGFTLEVEAIGKRRGADSVVKSAFPFAVLVAPPANQVVGLRPRSFFVLTTPGNLSPTQLDFYGRLGARVLRSNLVPDPTTPNWRAVETQLSQRIARNLSTIALLPIGSRKTNRAEAYFARQVPSNLANFGFLQTWELAGSVAPADLDAWSQIARSKRTDVALFAPMPSGLPALPAGASVRLSAVDALTFGWPEQMVSHPAALRRLWLSRSAAAKAAGQNGFHVRRETDDYATLSPGDAAGSLTADYLSAIISGASSMAEVLAPAGTDGSGASAGAISMARAAAFSMLSRTLEESAFSEELFPRSPLLEGALFTSKSSSTAIIYSPQGKGKMTLRAAPTQVFDVFGNPIARDNKGQISFPVSGQPVYVVTQNSPDVLAYALKNARIEGLQPFAAQVMPISRAPESDGPGSAAVRVRLQNIGIGPRTAKIKVSPPKGWVFAQREYPVSLAEGESKTYEFRATKTASAPKWGDKVPVAVEVNGRDGGDWKFEVPVVTALSVSANEIPQIDGNLNDWSDAIWQRADPNAANVNAQVAFKWDAKNLYVAARVREAALQARRPEETTYEFWDEYDALQIAFGTDDSAQASPARAPFRDSTRGFLISPFNQRGAQEYEGRVLKLWGPDLAYNRAADKVRWGGVISGSKCAISRDEQGQITAYEAQIPFAAMPEINPQTLAERDNGVRFGWLLHNDEGTALDFGRSLGNFAWWENTSTFLPEGQLSSALRATLGFTQRGDVAFAGTKNVTAPNAASPTAAPTNASPNTATAPFVAPPAPAPSDSPIRTLPLPAPPQAVTTPAATARTAPAASPTPAPTPTPKPTPAPTVPPAPPARLVPPANPDVLPPAMPPKEIAPFVVP